MDSSLQALFAAADKDGNGVLDEEEFLNVVSHSVELRGAFDRILQLGCEKRASMAQKRQAVLFRGPFSPNSHSAISPSGRRYRPSLYNLRRVRPGEVLDDV